jgi:predicted PurR-regulated permease PerM
MSTQPGRTVEIARRHLHDVLRMGTSDLRAPMLDSVESWNWAVRISVVGLFVLALAGILYSMASVVVPVLLAWVVAMVLLPVVDSLERRGLPRPLTLEGQVITPTLIGHRLTINPFLVFLAVAIWTWMWGPVGAFLGVPILLCGMVALRRLSSTGSENAGLHTTTADGQAI